MHKVMVQVRINPWVKVQISNAKSRTTAMGKRSFSNSNDRVNDFFKIGDSFKHGDASFKKVVIYLF